MRANIPIDTHAFTRGFPTRPKKVTKRDLCTDGLGRGDAALRDRGFDKLATVLTAEDLCVFDWRKVGSLLRRRTHLLVQQDCARSFRQNT